MWRRHVCYVCKRSVCGGDEPQPVAHLSHKLQCARQSLKIMVSYGNKYPRHNARPDVVEQSGQCARALIIHLFLPIKYIFLFRIIDTVSDILSVLLNFIANYDSINENIPPYCL